MKYLLIFTIVLSNYICLAQIIEDPFKSVEDDDEDMSFIENRIMLSDVIDDKLMKSLEESESNVFPKKNGPAVRIFIDSSGGKPILLKWLMPTDKSKDSILEVKRFEVGNHRNSKLRQYSCKLTKEQVVILREILKRANPLKLPSNDWMNEEVVGGTTWVFEFPLENASKILVRRNPGYVWGDEVYHSSNISYYKSAQEYCLATFAMMLMMVAEGLEKNDLEK